MNRSELIETEAVDARLAILGGLPVRTEKFGPRWNFGEEEKAQLMEVMERAQTSWRSGFKVREFTNKLQATYGVSNVIATSSGTASVHAALGAIDPDPGQEVITTAVTDIGSLIGILQHNLIPVFIDWDERYFNMDPEQIESRITERTCAILVVHLFGQPCDMTRIMEISRRRGIPVIEDCAQAHLATVGGRKVGAIGEIGCFSLGLKTLSTDQGGFVTTNDSDLAASIRGFLSKGSVKFGENWEPYSRLGAFYPMTDLQAAVGVAQLAKLEAATEARIKTAQIFDETFASLEGYTIPETLPECRHTYYVYPFHVEERRAGVSLEKFLAALKSEGIIDAFGPYLKGKPLYKFPLFSKARTYGRSGFPFRDENGVTRFDYSSLKLPVVERILPGLGFFHLRNSFIERDVRDIAKAIRKVALYYSRNRTNGFTDHTPSRNEALEVKPRGATSSAAEFLTGREHADYNSALLSRRLAELGCKGGKIELPQGSYYFSQPIYLEKIRNLVLQGQGGNYVNPGTRVIYTGVESGLHLRTAIHCRFIGLCFASEQEGAEPVVRIEAVEEGPAAVSSLNNGFEYCTFRNSSPRAAVSLKDAAHTEFKHCWFQSSHLAVSIGAAQRQPPPTISNGQCNNTVFDNCIFFSHVTGERGSNTTFQNCEFAALANGDGARIDFGIGAAPQMWNVAIRDCFAINGATHQGTFFRQGGSGAGLVMSNCRIRGYALAVAIDGLGAAVISSNVFEQTAPGASDILVKCASESVSFLANLHAKTLEAGNTPITRTCEG